jgi:transcriptional regulator with XRE-family HTH domain
MRDLSELMATILAANIKALRLREGPNQTEFAERMGVSQGTVARWEAGAKPQYEHIVTMAGMAGVSVQDFTGHLLAGDRPSFDASSATVFLPGADA